MHVATGDPSDGVALQWPRGGPDGERKWTGDVIYATLSANETTAAAASVPLTGN